MKINTKWQSPSLSNITLNINIKISNLTAEIGRMDLKNMIHLFAVHRRFNLEPKT